MSSGVSLQIEGVVESFATECAEISLGVTVTLHVSVEQPLQCEGLTTHSTGKLAWVRLTSHGGQLLNIFLLRDVTHHGVLDSVSSIDYL